jgi:chemosensory pili system protein ChpB (putative protein-glutamate methylesterase)
MNCTVGVVTDNPVAMMQVRTLMEEIGQSITYTLKADHVADAQPLYPSLWIVISQEAADIFEVLSEWSDAPILLADDMPAQENQVHYQQWKASFAEKICKMLDKVGALAVVGEHHAVARPYDAVWVLAASLGGPESMRVFLSHIDSNIPVAFVYAQHIEQDFDKILPKVLGKASQLPVFYANNGERLRVGEVGVIPSHHYCSVDRRGFFHVEQQDWKKPYTPNIDQVIENIAQHYRSKMGVIIFSGTCDDGAAASIHLKKAGVDIWAQQPEECISPAMPDAVINANAVSFIGTAEQLAHKMNERYRQTQG